MAPANNNKNIEKSQTYNNHHVVSRVFMHTHYYTRMPQKVVACCVFENEYIEREREKYCANLL